MDSTGMRVAVTGEAAKGSRLFRWWRAWLVENWRRAGRESLYAKPIGSARRSRIGWSCDHVATLQDDDSVKDGVFRFGVPVFVGILPLLGGWFTEDPCYLKFAVTCFLAWGYLGILVQLIRGELYDRFGFPTGVSRKESPRKYWNGVGSYLVLWAMFHLIVVWPYVLSRLACELPLGSPI